jgi:hypothetical protein
MTRLPRLRSSGHYEYRVPGSEDTNRYYVEDDPLNYENYAENRLAAIRDDFEERDPPVSETVLEKVWHWTWEMAHRRRMLLEGNRYARLRLPYVKPEGPALEYLLIGQLPMKLTEGWAGVPKAIAMTEKRVEYDKIDTFLNNLFRGHEQIFAHDY